jgi:hypothetical protein
MDEITRQYRDALRLLFILARAGAHVVNHPAAPDAVAVVDSEKKLQKLDFWVRNPDHFAFALLQAYDEEKDAVLLSTAKSIVDSVEPEIRRDAMQKYLYGAYEPLDTAAALLLSYGLIRIVRDVKTKQRMFFFLPQGLAKADELAAQMPEAVWYSERATLVGRFAEGKSGEQLAKWQYKHPIYAGAKNGETIASIAQEVREKIADLEASGG